MPTGSHRRQQCTYRERNTRCRRDGTGNPPLCAPHKLQAAEDARRAEAEENRSSIGSLFEDFLYGRPINREKVVSAVNEFAWGIGGGYGPLHEIFEEDVDGYDENAGEFEHERRNRQRPPHQREYKAPPPPDNEFLQQKLAIQRAKVALGFAESEPVTIQQVKQRQRELARKHHPDRGGSLETMQRINAAVDLLERVNRPVL